MNQETLLISSIRMEEEDAHQSPNDSEWEQIPPTYSNWDDGELVLIGTDSSVFHPSNHEDLPVIPQEPPSITDGDCDGTDRMRASFRVLRLGIVRLAYRVRTYSIRGVGVWSTAAGAGGAVAVIFAMAALCMRLKRRWRWRPKSRQQQNVDSFNLLIIKEKDQRIQQLLLQIAEMNRILAGSRGIPVPIPVHRLT